LLGEVSRRLGPAVVPLPLAGHDLLVNEVCARALEALGAGAVESPRDALPPLASRLPERGSALLLLIDDLNEVPPGTARELGALVEACGGGVQMVAAAMDGPGADRSLAALGLVVDVVRLLQPIAEDERRRYADLPEPAQTAAANPVLEEEASRPDPTPPPLWNPADPNAPPAEPFWSRVVQGEASRPDTAREPNAVPTSAPVAEEKLRVPEPAPDRPAELVTAPATSTRRSLAPVARRVLLAVVVVGFAAVEVAQFRALNSFERLLEEREISTARRETAEPRSVGDPEPSGSLRPTAGSEAPDGTGAGVSLGLEKALRSVAGPGSLALARGRGSGSYVYDAAADRLSLRAQDVPLIDLLETISERSGVTIEQEAIAGLDQPVTASMEDVSSEDALRLLLAGFQKIFFYDAAGRGEEPSGRLESVLVLGLKSPPGAVGETRALSLSEDAPAALLEALQEEDVAAAGAIAIALSETSGPREMELTVSETLDAMEPRPLTEYLSAVEVLAEAARERTIAELVKRMQPPDSAPGEQAVQATRRRSRAALGLGVVGDARALDPLMEVFQSSEREVRVAAADSIQRIQRLERELEEPDAVSDERELGREGLTPLRPKERNDGQAIQRFPEATYPEPTFPGSGPQLRKESSNRSQRSLSELLPA
jgi:hypothetical protein